MAEQPSEERTEDASPKKLQDAREEGNVPKSTEINSVVVLLASIILIKVFGGYIMDESNRGIIKYFDRIAQPHTVGFNEVLAIVSDSFMMFTKLSMPVILGVLIAGVVANIAQVGFMFTLKPLEPKLEKINPISGFARLFSANSVMETVKNIFKLAVVGIVAYITIVGDFDLMLTLSQTDPAAMWVFLLQLSWKLFLRCALALLVIAVIDYAWQRYQWAKKLRMTHQELKEEYKQMEGDPMIKRRIRSIQREMARRRMMAEVPKATVVVTNPTHLAIAIRYEPDEMEAPLVLAKGKLVLAEKIKEIAISNDIPIVEDLPLARAMYDRVEPGESIPVEFFNAVAEILAYVYKLKNRAA